MKSERLIDPSILRAYDIRGVIGSTLSEETAGLIGRGFGTMTRRAEGRRTDRPRVVVGYDGRLSSPAIANALCEGLVASGASVVEVGMGPTPMLYYAAHALDVDAGVQVTGSHNPPDYNGFKMLTRRGAFHGDDIQMLGGLIERGDFETGAADRGGRPILDDYVDRILADLTTDGRALSVAWDAGNGAAGPAMRMMCERMPGRHVLLHDDVDGTFPNHHPDPTVESNLADLKRAVADQGCDLGIAFDGDGDRIGVIDGEGAVLWGDQLLSLWAEDVLSENPGATVIADVKASQALFDAVAALGGKPLMWKTGHSLIKVKMKETGAPLAGEMSGHVFFADRYYGYDDALYAAIRLLNIVSRDGRSLAARRKAMPRLFNTPEIRIDCADERKFEIMEQVKRDLEQAQAEMSDIDGVRVRARDGWWLLRASNTQPVLVARCEAATQTGLKGLKTDLAAVLDRAGVSFAIS